jgi:hypothetical protein
MFRLLACLAFFYCHAVHAQAQAQDTWYGRYAFIDSGMNVTGTRSWVYEDLLDIRPDGDRIIAVYNATQNNDGFDHLAQRWIGQKRAHEIVFTFDSCLPRTTLAHGNRYQTADTSDPDPSDDDCADQHLRGTPMLTLAEKRGKNGKRVVLTYFHEFKPYLDKVPAGGVRYFRKLEPDNAKATQSR